MRKVALVTGASGGIGEASVRKICNSHDVLIHYHSNQESARELETIVENAGSRARIFQADLSSEAEIDELIRYTIEEFGKIDVLINNAGSLVGGRLEDITHKEIVYTIQVNLLGAIYLTKASLPYLLEQERAWVINISSMAGIEGSDVDPVYAAAKGGLISFTKSIANQFTREGLFANVVAPGPTDTSMVPRTDLPPPEEISPLERLVKPTEVADAIEFFTKTTAISGRVLEVSGGK